MKVVGVNGSPRAAGNTQILIEKIFEELESEELELTEDELLETLELELETLEDELLEFEDTEDLELLLDLLESPNLLDFELFELCEDAIMSYIFLYL